MDNFEILHRKYAKALIDFATEKRVADKIEEGLEKIIGILNNNQYLYDVLIHPEISLDEKRSLIGEICRRADFCHELKDFLLLLLKANRFKLLHGIFLKYRDFHDERKKRIKIFIKSAFALSAQEKSRLLKTLESRLKRRVILEEKIFPDLIAGVIIKSGSVVFDNSLNKNLRILSQKLGSL